MKKVFVDTSGWLSVVLKSDALHEKAVLIYQKLIKSNYTLITHSGVMLGVGNSLSPLKARNLAVQLKQSVESTKIIQFVALNDELYEAGWQLYTDRPDKDWGIIDCISFVLMEREEIREALTADHHFEGVAIC